MCKQCVHLELKIKSFYLNLNIKIKEINFYIFPYYKKICFKNNLFKIKNFIQNLDILPIKHKNKIFKYIYSSKFTNLRR